MWHAFSLSWYLHIKMCQERDLKVMPLLSHRYVFCLLIPWSILWEKRQLWTLSRKYEEARTSFNDWSESYLLSRMEWWSVTLTLPQALHLWLWEMTVELMWCRVEGRRKSSAQTRSQISLHLLSNQVIFDHMQVNISVIKLWCVTGTFSFLTLTAELVVPWPGMRSQTGHV